jgi:hypothetical protein
VERDSKSVMVEK